jgi:hypothetical protein
LNAGASLTKGVLYTGAAVFVGSAQSFVKGVRWTLTLSRLPFGLRLPWIGRGLIDKTGPLIDGARYLNTFLNITNIGDYWEYKYLGQHVEFAGTQAGQNFGDTYNQLRDLFKTPPCSGMPAGSSGPLPPGYIPPGYVPNMGFEGLQFIGY